jgi:acyl phosphate:glycerol-3-phosphate acyltransferase
MEISELFGFAVIIIGAYLAGSIPSGVILTKVFAGQDIRQQGSGNIGATNVARVAGMRLGLLTLALDLLKGAGPVYLAGRFGPGTGAAAMTLATLAAVGGHLYPVYSGFKGGGKGVATAGGCFLVLSAASCLAAIGVFALVAFLTRRVSAGSLAAALSLPVFVWFFSGQGVFVAGAGLVSLFVVIRHKDNIVRLFSGKEPAFSGKRNR